VSLPASIGNLRKLQVLGLDNNKLENIPPEIGALGSLTVLYLFGNQLAAVP
jgi:Leucine-rich repeat (LRR) protein